MSTVAGYDTFLHRFPARNAIALGGLLLAMYLPDYHAIHSRADWNKWTPYLFAVLLYGWLVFHNRILFERLFVRGKRRAYVFWTALVIAASSLNIMLCMHYLYESAWAIPILVKFYVFTFTGFGMYVVYRQSVSVHKAQPAAPLAAFSVVVDGHARELDPAEIVYLESLENYLRIFTLKEQLVCRMTMKEAASRLPNHFLRINRSCLVNTFHVLESNSNEVTLAKLSLRIGRTYKQHVQEYFKHCP